MERALQRLQASRDRPKRQFLLDTVATLWSPPPRSCFRPRAPWSQLDATPEAIALVASFAQDPREEVRRAALRALGKVSRHRELALPALHAALHDESVLVRLSAMQSLAAVPHPESRAHFADALVSPTWTLRWLAAGALAELDPSLDLTPVLLEARPRRGSSHWDWLDALRKLGPRARAAIPVLRELHRARATDDRTFEASDIEWTLRCVEATAISPA